MNTRYVVRACDNDGSVEGLARDRTWDVVEKTATTAHGTTEAVVASVLTRADAYAVKRRFEAEAEVEVKP